MELRTHVVSTRHGWQGTGVWWHTQLGCQVMMLSKHTQFDDIVTCARMVLGSCTLMSTSWGITFPACQVLAKSPFTTCRHHVLLHALFVTLTPPQACTIASWQVTIVSHGLDASRVVAMTALSRTAISNCVGET